MAERTYYDILKIRAEATPDEIREAYRSLSTVWHPDRFKQGTKVAETAAEEMKAIKTAYDVLKDPARRAEYDRALREAWGWPLEPETPPPPRFTPEQELTIENNRERYVRILTSVPMRKFCEGVGLESLRQKALREIKEYELNSAWELLRRYNQAAR